MMVATAIHCVLLDLGKVLLDVEPREFGKRMRSLTGLEEWQLHRIFLEDDIVERYETGRISDVEFHAEVCSRAGVAIEKRSFDEAWNSVIGKRPLVSQKVLASLSARVPLWILSNTNKIHFDFISARHAFLRYFRGYILSHEVGLLKPDAGIFEHALRKTASQPSETLFVDDQIANVEAARRMGIDAFQFLDADQFQRELTLRGLL